MTSQRFIGRHDWHGHAPGQNNCFGQKARPLITGRGTTGDEANEFIAISMALMFLAKGRWPVLLAKLRLYQ